MKKASILLITMLFASAISLAGCSGGKSKTVGTTASPEEDAKSPITFTFFTGNPAATGAPSTSAETKLGKIIQEKTGVTLKYDWLVGDLSTKIGVMNASGDYPDLIWGGSGKTPDFVNAGALIPLEDLIEKEAPHLKKYLEPVWNRIKDPDDGHIYYIPNGVPQGGTTPMINPPNGFYIQKEVLAEAGWPKLQYLEDYFEVIKKYKEKHPTIDGKETIGFADYWQSWMKMIDQALMPAAGWPNDSKVGYDPKTKQITLRETSEAAHKYLRILNKYFNEGLIDPESFIHNEQQFKAKLASGRVLGFYNFPWFIAEPANALKQQGHEERTWFAFPLLIDSTYKQPPQPLVLPSGEGFGISVKAKDPDRLIRFLDYLAQDDTQKLLYWGVKGDDYEVNDKGRMYRTKEQRKRSEKDPAYDAKAGFGLNMALISPSGTFDDGNARMPGDQVENVEYTDWDKEFMAKYNLKDMTGMYNKESPTYKYFPLWNANLGDGTPAKIFETDLWTQIDEYYPKLVMCKTSEFEPLWKEFTAKVGKLDVNAYFDALRKVIDYREKNF